MIWLALAIGNSRLHWAWFIGQELQESWHIQHLSPTQMTNWSSQIDQPQHLKNYLTNAEMELSELPIYLISVVPTQTASWQPYVAKIWSLEDLPLQNLYPTLGIDRAIAAYGAGELYGYPVLVIDAGTALTITGLDGKRSLIGGAIWPGLSLQFKSLGRETATLPSIELSLDPAPRWARDTTTAIWSGVIHGAISTIKDFVHNWLQIYPDSAIVITGGDGELLQFHLQKIYGQFLYSHDLVFLGIAKVLALHSNSDGSIPTQMGRLNSTRSSEK